MGLYEYPTVEEQLNRKYHACQKRLMKQIKPKNQH